MKTIRRITALISMCNVLCATALQAAEPKTLKEALLNYPWEWTHAPRPPDLLIFNQDGTAICTRFGLDWKITGSHTALGSFHPKPNSDIQVKLKFDASFSTLQGSTLDGKYHYTGRRLPPGSTGATTPVSASTSRPSAPLATIQSDPSQPRIQVIKDQGPNASEWALTPLDEAIPADIRQNLTSLREDLLDEVAKAAKASPRAYQLASEYCDKILATISQRELARVNAGYRSAQVEANKATSNQALNARRNYMMSWPQYAREESQRSSLRENESDKADVKKEQLKVEWAARAEQMRKALDGLYAQLRAALRE